jgi:hypothetical protein
MTTEKTEYLNWDVPTFPSNNIASELDTLFTQIDETVYAIDGSGGSWTISDGGVEILPLPSDINFGSDLDAFDNGDGSVTIVSNALSSDDKGTSNGVAELDSSGNVPSSQLPSIAISQTNIVANKSERLSLDAEKGDVAIQQDENQSYILKDNDPTADSSWSILKSPTSDLTSVYGRTGDVVAETGDYTHDQIGGQSSDDHHTRYNDDEALSVIGTEPIGHPSYTTLSDAPTTSLGDVFHVDGEGLYVKTDGVDTIDNSDTPLQVHIDDNTNPHNVSVPVDSVNGKTGAVNITDISGDADTVDGYDIQKNGTDGPGIINIKTE